jgi:hypothetical protein
MLSRFGKKTGKGKAAAVPGFGGSRITSRGAAVLKCKTAGSALYNEVIET